jgi:hypothetical protein
MNAFFLIVIFLIVLLIALLLLAPFHLDLNIRKKGPLRQGGFRLAWLGLTLRRTEFSEQKEAGEEQEQSVGKTGVVPYFRLSSLINAAPALLGILFRLFRSIHIKEISGRVCFGLDDPAETAVLIGYLFSAAAAFGLYSDRVSLVPWFEGERLEGDLVVQVEAKLLWAAWAIIQALREKEIRLLLKEMAGWK